MSKTAFVRARVEPSLKIVAESVLRTIGITPTQAITMLYKKVVIENQWPLEMKIPNEITKKVFEETDCGMGVVECKSVDDLFAKIGLKSTNHKVHKRIQKRHKVGKKTR